MSLLGRADRHALLPGVAHDASCPDGGLIQVNDIDIHSYLGGQLLPKADLLGMMHGVEVRAPFLDFRLIEFARSLDPALKLGQPSKPILRSLLARTVPNLPDAPAKQGFGAPLVAWLADPIFLRYVRERLFPGAKLYDLFDADALKAQLDAAFIDPQGINAYRIWLFLCLELWACAWPVGSLRFA